MKRNDQIRDWLRQTYDVRGVKDCHIAHAKELSGLPVQPSWNRQGPGRVVPCPDEKLPYIQAAFRHFHMM